VWPNESEILISFFPRGYLGVINTPQLFFFRRGQADNSSTTKKKLSPGNKKSGNPEATAVVVVVVAVVVAGPPSRMYNTIVIEPGHPTIKCPCVYGRLVEPSASLASVLLDKSKMRTTKDKNLTREGEGS